MLRLARENRVKLLVGFMTVCVSTVAGLTAHLPFPDIFGYLGPMYLALLSTLASTAVVVVVFRRAGQVGNLTGRTPWVKVNLVFWSSLFSVFIGLLFERNESEWPGLAMLWGSAIGAAIGFFVGLLVANMPPQGESKASNGVRRLVSGMAAGISVSAVLGIVCVLFGTCRFVIPNSFGLGRMDFSSLAFELGFMLVLMILGLMPSFLLFGALTGALAFTTQRIAGRWEKRQEAMLASGR